MGSPSSVSYVHLTSLQLSMRLYEDALESTVSSLRLDPNPSVINKDNPYLSLGFFFLVFFLFLFLFFCFVVFFCFFFFFCVLCFLFCFFFLFCFLFCF